MTENKLQSTQNRLLERIQEVLPPHKSMVDELSDLLEISSDSVYRRLRGETALSIEETAKICKKFQISFDSITDNITNSVSFNYGLLKNEDDFIKHMKFILGELELFKQTKGTKLTYAAIDIPIFHHFQFYELAAFKMFYWLKSVVNDENLTNKQFSPDLISPELMATGKQMYNTYKAINSTEIWTDATVNSLIKQIEFYWESGMFESKEDAILVCEQTELEILGIQEQAGINSKTEGENNYNLFFSEIEIGNNCIYAESDIFKRAYLSYNTINILISTHKYFCEGTQDWLNNFIKKSTLISGASEKIRYQFFRRAIENIKALKKRIQE